MKNGIDVAKLKMDKYPNLLESKYVEIQPCEFTINQVVNSFQKGMIITSNKHII